MAQGLKPHHHNYFDYEIRQHYDRKHRKIIKKIHKMCIICGCDKWECVECYIPPQNKKRS